MTTIPTPTTKSDVVQISFASLGDTSLLDDLLVVYRGTASVLYNRCTNYG